ncbi:hypothetical protein BU24DRAFT_411867 [Aaosphaeria arxii CBS 175.79]|uniref:Uncharacterized protein n=1 Tax=Aaosphaeria arxii CBS 175.79 TaxID=1450172 RepID=A0A6A5XJM7_9PLEO|nr:uncharacterized protein BU24DRAFT_411867 [Aaosphaeria arxii CBS 175.79]KAF2012504.1 hypothetical protein BU24DRAFT_411867 [Aaosphaeria arxii CBS 175.79]
MFDDLKRDRAGRRDATRQDKPRRDDTEVKNPRRPIGLGPEEKNRGRDRIRQIGWENKTQNAQHDSCLASTLITPNTLIVCPTHSTLGTLSCSCAASSVLRSLILINYTQYDNDILSCRPIDSVPSGAQHARNSLVLRQMAFYPLDASMHSVSIVAAQGFGKGGFQSCLQPCPSPPPPNVGMSWTGLDWARRTNPPVTGAGESLEEFDVYSPVRTKDALHIPSPPILQMVHYSVQSATNGNGYGDRLQNH